MFWLFFLSITLPMRSGMCENTNLAAIKWAHAVNSQDLLKQALDSNEIHAIEADVVMGTIEKIHHSVRKIPVMGHPPVTHSDLSLGQFLKNVREGGNSTKIVKLDFKSTEAINESVKILEKVWEAESVSSPQELMLNADIIEGPRGLKMKPVDAKHFFEAAKRLESATLSIGWTTPLWISHSQKYSFDHVRVMIEAIRDSKIGTVYPITFPVRAALAVNSQDTLGYLYEEVSRHNPTTFTVWSAQHDKVDAEQLRKFIKLFGTNKVYVDVPENLETELNLNHAI